MLPDPVHVDLAFPVHGNTIPIDHGYPLYGAISRAVPDAHGAGWLAIHTISARLASPGLLDLQKLGTLRIRVPGERIQSLLGLTGASLDVAGNPVTLGAPTVHPLVPAATLDARLVVIKVTGGVGVPFNKEGFEAKFLAEARRQLEKRGIAGIVELCGRQRITVAGRRVIGYSMRVGGLSAEHSLTLQVHGIGGKRTMGCGVFRPARIKERARQAA